MQLFCIPIPISTLTNLAIPVVSSLIVFLAYTSQFLFYYIEPGSLTRSQAIWFNIFVLFIWWCYYSACTVDAAPVGWVSKAFPVLNSHGMEAVPGTTARWCKKCQAVKPPRAHHCKICTICIPKMDHHCPWIANCVSHLNFPHFFRFVFYSVISMSILAYHLSIRVFVLWKSRHAPAYLGPSEWALLHLLVLFVSNNLILLALIILLSRITYGLMTNTTTIESWEIERHESIVERYRRTGGNAFTGEGQQMRIQHQEFPYDIGIWKNIYQAMGTKNILMWFMPFGGAPAIHSAGNWEVNGFEDNDKVWPPPDPDKVLHFWHMKDDTSSMEYSRIDDSVAAFKERQENDLRKRGHNRNLKLYEISDHSDENLFDEKYDYKTGVDGEKGWTNNDGDRLQDFGVDEEVD